MRFLICTLILLSAGVLRGQATAGQDCRMRATEPTVISVDDSRQKTTGNGKVRRSARAGVAQAARGIVSVAGWLLNTKDDIPRAQDRECITASRQ